MEYKEAVLNIAKRLRIFPCSSKTKRPYIKNWPEKASSDPKQIAEWWDEWPTAYIGCPTGESNNLWVLDTDLKPKKDIDGEENLKAFLEEREETLIETRKSQTQGGGFHRFFKWDPENPVKCTTGEIAEGIDTRGEGGYVILPPSKGYKWVNKNPVHTAPEETMDWVPLKRESSEPKNEVAVREEIDPEDLQETLDAIDPTKFRERGEWMKIMMACHHASQGEDWGLDAFTQWSLRDEHGFEEDPVNYIAKMWPTLKDKDEGITFGSLMHYAEMTRPDVAQQFKIISNETDMIWDKTPNGKRLLTTIRNMSNYLTGAEISGGDNPLVGMFAYNELARQVVTVIEPPWQTSSPRNGRPLEDNDVTNVRLFINSQWGVAFPKDIVADAIQLVASRNKNHPVRNYLESLEWDGVERLEHWLETYAGSPDSRYTRAVGAKTLIACVARAMRPGCEVHTMLVLEGPQGTGKTQTVKILGGEWYGAPMLDIGSKEAPQALKGLWLVEMEEMAATTKAESDQLKKFLSTAKDEIRVAYRQFFETWERQCVFIGTINPPPGEVGYLKDETGARRFWPVRTGEFNLNALERDRDQIWAEAKMRYDRGDHWWIDQHEVDLQKDAKKEQDLRGINDPWDYHIAECLVEGSLGSRDFVTVSEVLENAVGVPSRDHSPYITRRASKCLSMLGWDSGRGTINGKRVRGFNRPLELVDPFR